MCSRVGCAAAPVNSTGCDRECVELLEDLGMPVEHIVLTTHAYEHKIFIPPFQRRYGTAQVWVVPRCCANLHALHLCAAVQASASRWCCCCSCCNHMCRVMPRCRSVYPFLVPLWKNITCAPPDAVRPRQWSFPLDLPLPLLGIFNARVLPMSDGGGAGVPWADEIQFENLSEYIGIAPYTEARRARAGSMFVHMHMLFYNTLLYLTCPTGSCTLCVSRSIGRSWWCMCCAAGV